MSIARFAIVALLFASGLAVTAACSVEVNDTALSRQIEPRPNIVVFNLDDMARADFESNGPLRSVVEGRGADFRNPAVTTSLCCPSRVSTLTGQYTHNHGIQRHVGEGRDGVIEGYPRYKEYGLDKDNLAVWLQDSGYATAMVGKLMNGYRGEEVDPGWTEWYASVSSWKNNVSLNENGEVRSYKDRRRDWEDILGNKSVKVIEEHAGEKPIFLYHNPHAPHGPLVWPERHDGRFRTAGLPQVGAVNEKNVSDKPAYIRKLDRLDRRDLTKMEQKHRQRMRSELAVANALQRVEKALERKGELDNTIFFFTSDNGYHLGSHRLPAGKQTPYRTDHEVPLAVWGGEDTDVKKANRDHLVTNVDFAPTILDLTGTSKAGKKLDGESFVGALDGSVAAKDWRRYQLWEGYDNSGLPSSIAPPGYSAVRTLKGAVFVRYSTEDLPAGDTALEYYDLNRDPHQKNNRVDSMPPKHRRKLDELRDRLFQCVGSGCVAARG